MSEKPRTFEAEVRLVKSTQLIPGTKPEETTVKQTNVRLKRGQKTFSRETVIRLINWFKQD